MNIVIGIISYFPDNNTRTIRCTNLLTLINKCNVCFNIPILIVAQNYTEQEADTIGAEKNVTLTHHPKLGIVGARKELRKLFLESEYDYLIMLDDDCIIGGTPSDAQKYLEAIQKHPGGWGAKRKRLLKLFAISREVYSQIEMPDINPEKNEGFEDILFYETLRTKFRNSEFEFQTRLTESSNSSTDPNSTWRNEYKNSINRKELCENTTKAIQKMKGLIK